MHWIPNRLNAMVMKAMAIHLKSLHEFRVWGLQTVPPAPVLFCSNHFSSHDPFFALSILPPPVHMVVGSAFEVPFWKHVLAAAEHINALPENRSNVVEQAAGYLRKGESVYIFPEGTLNDFQSLSHFYSGMARIYLACPCPIVPIGLISPRRCVRQHTTQTAEGVAIHRSISAFNGKYYANIGAAMRFPEWENEADTARAREGITQGVRDKISDLIHQIKTELYWN